MINRIRQYFIDKAVEREVKRKKARMNNVANLGEALDFMIEIVDPNELAAFSKLTEKEAQHGGRFSGMAIRNEFNLWNSHSQFAQWFYDNNIWHADDMSMVLFHALWKRLNNERIRPIEEWAEYFENWWEETYDGDSNPKYCVLKNMEDEGINPSRWL